MALPKKNRIVSKKDIDLVFKNGLTVRGSFLFIKLAKNQKNHSRLAFIISSKHIPLAVDRNRIRRLLSIEATRFPNLLTSSHDIVVGLLKKVIRNQFRYLGEDLNKVLSKINTG